MSQVYLHIGSNQGERQANLSQAVELMRSQVGQLKKASRIFETAAWGITDQPDFLNQALAYQTHLDPIALLDTILSIEQDMGRVRVKKWGQRQIDIDIIYYDHLIWDSEQLTLPHPHLHKRNFVLQPLMDIAPDFVHPKFKQTTRDLLNQSSDVLPVHPLGPK